RVTKFVREGQEEREREEEDRFTRRLCRGQREAPRSLDVDEAPETGDRHDRAGDHDRPTEEPLPARAVGPSHEPLGPVPRQPQAPRELTELPSGAGGTIEVVTDDVADVGRGGIEE